MNNKCIYFKIRTHKGVKYFFCTKNKAHIELNDCKKCNCKEYKKSVLKPFKSCQKKDKNNISIMPPSEYYSNTKIKYAHKHHILLGRNRNNSEKYGLFIWLSPEQHSYLHEHPHLMENIKKESQVQWKMRFGNREDFISIFRISYLKE